MKDESITKHTTRVAGFSTLEIIIALGILSLTLSAIILLVFTNASLALDTDLANHGLSIASNEFQILRARTASEFDSLVSTSSAIVLGDLAYDGLYTKALSVTDLTPCRKNVTQTISWKSSFHPADMTLSTLSGSRTELLNLGNDCGGDVDTGNDWTNPQSQQFSISVSGTVTGMDVKNGIAYVIASTTPSTANFFVVDTKHSTLIAQKYFPGSFQAIDVAGNYAYLANASSTEQFKVVDISTPSAPALVASASLPGLTKGLGQSIFYYNTKIYIGTQYLACVSCSSEKNNELHIFDVSNPAYPLWQGSFKANTNVNAIALSGNTAYLATSADDRELVALGVTNPSHILQTGIFNATDTAGGTGEDGTALFVLGHTLFLARERAPSTRPDFYVLDISTSSTPVFLGSLNLALATNTVVKDVVIFEKYSFVATTDPKKALVVVDMSDPKKPLIKKTFSLGAQAIGVDYENNHIFVALANGSIIIFSPQ